MLGESLPELQQRYYHRIALVTTRVPSSSLRFRLQAELTDLYVELLQDHPTHLEACWLRDHLVWLCQQLQRMWPLPDLLAHLLRVLGPALPSGTMEGQAPTPQ